MPFFSLGINHQTAPVAIREKLAFNREQIPAALKQITALPDVSEAVILSTCNRTEIYCELDAGNADVILDWLASERTSDDPAVRERFYQHRDRDSVAHLLRVACGLDSQVLGEPQILGQLKQAYDDARRAGTAGPMMHRLFQHSFSVAKQVRTETAIGANALSVAYAAVSMARQIFGDLSKHTALLVGAGETIELAASYLRDRGLQRMIIANRTLERAQQLASQYQGFAIPLPELDAHLGDADIVISATASPELVLRFDMVKRAFADRKHRPMFLVDLAVPRDIDARIGEFDDAYLYTVDDLESVIEENRAGRQAAAIDAEAIVHARADAFIEQQKNLEHVPLIQSLRLFGEQEQQRAMEKAERMLANGKPADEVMRWLAGTLTNRLLHGPTSGLKDAAANNNRDVLDAIRAMFHLDDNDDRSS